MLEKIPLLFVLWKTVYLLYFSERKYDLEIQTTILDQPLDQLIKKNKYANTKCNISKTEKNWKYWNWNMFIL